MNHIKKSLTILAAMAAMAAFATAADAPNFSGTWKLNVDKSTFGPIPPPTSGTRKVDHKDPNLTVETAQSSAMGDQNTTMKLTTDGKETTNDMMGNPVKCTAKWDGAALVISESLDFQGTAVTINDKWTLSDDGKTLTSATHIVSPQGEFDLTQIFEKQ